MVKMFNQFNPRPNRQIRRRELLAVGGLQSQCRKHIRELQQLSSRLDVLALYRRLSAA